jgi:beta-lactamase class A
MKAPLALLFFALSTAALTQRLTTIAADAPATIGVAAVDLTNDARVAIRGDERFPMGSVFKFPVALAFLRLVDAGQFRLADEVTIPVEAFAPGFSPIRDAANGKPVRMTYRAIVTAMLRDSDNTAADFLLPKVGGGAGVTKRLRELGVEAIRVDRSEREMAADLARPGGVARYAADPRDSATPNAMLALLRKFERGDDGLSPASHAFALALMAETGTGADRIKAGLPAGTRFAHKTGTMPGTANDVGIVVQQRILIAVFTKSGTTKELRPREQAIAAIGRAVWEEFRGR